MKLEVLPTTPIMKYITAIPEPLPVPKARVSACCMGDATAIKGSKTWSAKNPPRNKPNGIVLYWIVSRAENTRPCISTGTFVRMTAVKLAVKKGINTLYAKAESTQIGNTRPKLMIGSQSTNDIPQVKKITLVRLFAGLVSVTAMPPASVPRLDTDWEPHRIKKSRRPAKIFGFLMALLLHY
ncbi:hypothetical protein HNQ80_003650 [Anaerosolibacter carboniphilus]|uniref:Uncharacterized protein n=1 Tax=Anaerosolibacter carboniphilus TaxID=1417629 RepID=A0A841L543_9FIRM|nr:hypothetical protein [Anaerosolibacter carboniphilus]MBB6217529.1 hypothetical protein [Anaerosolibacter carboniphilus]